MAKIILPSLFAHLSGTVRDTRYYRINKIDYVASYTPYHLSQFSIQQRNQQKAFSLVRSEYQYLKTNYPIEYQSWLEEAKDLERKLGRTVTVVQLFNAFFLSKYQSELGKDVEPKTLTGRGGFGTCSFGTGRYGGITICQALHYKDRFMRIWLGFDQRLGYGIQTFGTQRYGTHRS